MNLPEHCEAARRLVERMPDCNEILYCDSFADGDRTAWTVTIYETRHGEPAWVVHEGDDLIEHPGPIGLPELVQCCIEDIWREATGMKLGLVEDDTPTREDFDRLKQENDRLRKKLEEVQHD